MLLWLRVPRRAAFAKFYRRGGDKSAVELGHAQKLLPRSAGGEEIAGIACEHEPFT
jgi:hypothetical protein